MSTEDQAGTPVKNKLGCVILGCVAFVILAALVLPVFYSARSAARGNSCNCRLKQLGMALLNYESTYHCFPPAYLADASGKPMHSWRVLVLPYMELQEIYDQYDFNEPWDGPHNHKLAEKMPDGMFCCPAADRSSNETNYVAVVGAQTGWPGAATVSPNDMHDGMSKTIAIVEVINSGINWLEPRDMTFEQAMKGINPAGSGLKISSNHGGGANVGFFDCHVSFLAADCSPEVLRSLLTIAGGETVEIPDN
jgi:prepilin-type processing-associated H-X9-DG protein